MIRLENIRVFSFDKKELRASLDESGHTNISIVTEDLSNKLPYSALIKEQVQEYEVTGLYGSVIPERIVDCGVWFKLGAAHSFEVMVGDDELVIDVDKPASKEYY